MRLVSALTLAMSLMAIHAMPAPRNAVSHIGISAGLFWASEAAVAVGYPEPSKRGRYLNIWVWWRTLGPIVGGAIVLALNNENGQRGHVSTNTYLIFIALQCLSVPVALALSPPEKVRRKDGTKVQPAKVTLKQTFIDLWRCLQRREILLLLPIFSAAYFNSYYGGNRNA